MLELYVHKHTGSLSEKRLWPPHEQSPDSKIQYLASLGVVWCFSPYYAIRALCFKIHRPAWCRWEVLVSRRRTDPAWKIITPPNSSLQAACCQVQYSTVGLSVIHSCLKTPAVPCCLCTHSDVLGLMVSAALPNTPAAWLPPTAERGNRNVLQILSCCSSRFQLEVPLPVAQTLPCYSVWVDFVPFRCALGSFALREAELPG